MSDDDKPTSRICPVCQGQTLWVKEVEVEINGRRTVQHQGRIIVCRWCTKGLMSSQQYRHWQRMSRNGLIALEPDDDPLRGQP